MFKGNFFLFRFELFIKIDQFFTTRRMQCIILIYSYSTSTDYPFTSLWPKNWGGKMQSIKRYLEFSCNVFSITKESFGLTLWKKFYSMEKLIFGANVDISRIVWKFKSLEHRKKLKWKYCLCVWVENKNSVVYRGLICLQTPSS